jgi:Cu-processing system ATP-binding protein
LSTNLIEVRSAVRRFGTHVAVDHVDLDVAAGRLFGLIGHNGAGKTTLFRMLLGLLPPDAGEIRIGGTPVYGRAFREVRRTIGYLPESAALYDHLTGVETLRFFARLKGSATASVDDALARVGLADARARAVGSYSKGMRQRLALAQALLGRPRLLFLDEPTNGLDPAAIRTCYGLLRELCDEGVTVVLTSHVLADIEQRVDQVALMSGGRIAAQGTVAQLRATLALPLDIRVSLQPGGEPALQRAAREAGAGEVSVEGARAAVRCARERKMAVLHALAAQAPGVDDIEIVEPSLEDVFMGYARRAA